MDSKWNSLHPPPPDEQLFSFPRRSKENNQTISSSEEGKHLFSLLKAIEKDNELHISNHITKALDIFSVMENLYLRRGLFEYDTERALEIQSKMKEFYASNQSNLGGRSGSGKKRKRGGGNGGDRIAASAGNIAAVLGINGGNSTSSIGKEAYALSNICRVLIPITSSSSNSLNTNESCMKYPPVVITAACNIFIAICTHSSNHLPSTTATIEHSMISSIASQVLGGLSKLSNLLLNVNENSNKTQLVHAMTACCHCASTLIAIAGVTLSRNTKVLGNLQNSARSILWHSDWNKGCNSIDDNLLTQAKEAAACLLSTLPLASNSNGVAPSTLWTNMLQSYSSELLVAFGTFYPNRGNSKRKSKPSENDSLPWIEDVKSISVSQEERMVIFMRQIDGYVSVIISFLEMKKYDQTNCSITSSVPMNLLLDMLEVILSFSSTAETKHISTKARLRTISVEGGLFSPNAAMIIANWVKFKAQLLLQVVIKSLSNSCLTFGKRLINIALTSLQSCSSNVLRQVIDPASTAVGDKVNHKKSLHSAISLRSMSVQSFAFVMQKIGSNAIVSQAESVGRGLVYVVGYVLEQIQDEKSMTQEKYIADEHWGTVDERAKLVEICIDTLSTCLVIFGGYMPLQHREMVESLTLQCLENIRYQRIASFFCNYKGSTISILKLGMNCASTPWPDGGASTIIDLLRSTAFELRFDRDMNVSSTAYTALNMCNSLLAPRSPPLVIVTRDKTMSAFNNENMNTIFTTTALETGINNVAKNKKETLMINAQKQDERNAKVEAKMMKLQESQNNKVELERNQKSLDAKELSVHAQGDTHDDSKNLSSKSLQVVNNSEVVSQIQTPKQKSASEMMDWSHVNAKDKISEGKQPGDDHCDEAQVADSRDSSENIEKDTVNLPATMSGETNLEDSNKCFDDNDVDDEEGSDDDLPPIVDCDPDEEDVKE
mmetsp:Transcript_4967/g.6419  ORF Transcript_4967/g.6419 Transcript_4967/m.6419 type:complete len:947 (+) Transcript_4967:38-2878(+)